MHSGYWVLFLERSIHTVQVMIRVSWAQSVPMDTRDTLPKTHVLCISWKGHQWDIKVRVLHHDRVASIYLLGHRHVPRLAKASLAAPQQKSNGFMHVVVWSAVAVPIPSASAIPSPVTIVSAWLSTVTSPLTSDAADDIEPASAPPTVHNKSSEYHWWDCKATESEHLTGGLRCNPPWFSIDLWNSPEVRTCISQQNLTIAFRKVFHKHQCLLYI